MLQVLENLDAGVKPRAAALRVRDTNVPAAVRPEKAEKAGQKEASRERSMSQVLQERSQAAVTARKSLEPPSPVPDIDSADKDDPLAASEYIGDIFSYYKRVEPHFRVTPDYMARQVRNDASSSTGKLYYKPLPILVGAPRFQLLHSCSGL